MKRTKDGKYILEWSKGTGNKKYKVIVYNKDKKLKTVQFGDVRYEQYKDTTPLGLYKHKDHLDPKRRQNYRKRHGSIKKDGKLAYKIKYSPAYMSWHYLW